MGEIDNMMRMLQGMMAIDAWEELKSFEKSVRKLGIPPRLMLQSVEAAHNVGMLPQAKLHVDYHRLLHDKDLLQYGLSTCRLALPLVRTLIHGVCVAYPNSLPDRLPAIAMFFLWIYTFDDFFDDPHIVGDHPHIDTTLAFVQTSLRSSLLLIDDNDTQSVIATANHTSLLDVLHSAAPWCENFRHLGMPTAQQRRLVHTLEAYVAAVFQQNQYRCSGSYPADVPAYLALRATDSGAYCCLDLVEFSLGIDVQSGLPPGTEGLRAALDELCFKAAVEVALYNDLRSIQKDFEGNDVFNMIMYVYVQMKKRMGKKEGREEEELESMKLVEAAMKEVVRMVAENRVEARRVEAEIEHLLLLLSKKESTGNSERRTMAEGIRRYLGGVADVAAGLGHWQELSVRYNS